MPRDVPPPVGAAGVARRRAGRAAQAPGVVKCTKCGAPMRFVPCGGAGGFRGDAGDVACRALGYAALKPEDTPCPVPPGGPSERPPKPCSPEDCCEKHPEDPVAQIPSSTTLKAHSHTHTAQEGPCPLPSGHRAIKSVPFCEYIPPPSTKKILRLTAAALRVRLRLRALAGGCQNGCLRCLPAETTIFFFGKPPFCTYLSR